MKTISLNTKECSDVAFIENKQKEYSYAFRKLYAQIDKLNDKKIANVLKKKFNLTEIEYRSLQSDVANKYEQTKTNKSNQEQRIIDIACDLKNLKSQDKTNKITRSKFKKNKKIKELEGSLSKNITFGEKVVLRELTKLYNNIEVIKLEKDLIEREKLLSVNQIKIKEKTKEWKENRILHFYILGEANQKGNRFFDFDFKNHTIIYKPYKGKKVIFKYSCSKKYQKQLIKIKELVDKKEISLTLQISKKQICISFDDEILSGFYIDKKERRKEVESATKNIVSKTKKKEIINSVYKKYYNELRDKKLIGKNEQRYVSVDLNPDYIGYCIADKGEYGIKKIIEKGVIDLRLLNEKLNLPSNDKLVIKQSNKRKNELQNSWKKLFNIINHHKCSYFIKEDIDGIGKNEAFESSEANRKVKNIWHRNLTEWQIKKRCVEYGIELIEINACYTSFIGNLIYNYFDATNAAIEICRRGMFKFKTGLFYPKFTGTISDTMSRFLIQQNIELKPRDAQIFKDCNNWVSLYKIASDNVLRWRWGWDDVEKSYSTFSMNNIKSKVKLIRFSN